MVNSIAMAGAAVIDALNDLLEAELNSVFRFMGEGSPYLSRATAEIRKPLSEMVAAGNRRSMELAEMIDQLGGLPLPGSVQPEEQYLAFLTLKFLLPKLADAKRLMIQRYENMLRALSGAPPEVIALLDSHLAEHRADLQVLQRAAADLLTRK
jgi:hypothetical protein